MIEKYITLAKNENGLSEAEMQAAIRHIMNGDASDSDLETFLTLLSARGETADEITGAARVLREKAAMITAPEGAVDCCGTGGDGLHTFNISTSVAFVAASCGVPVAKHGNRASSSKCGAADVLEEAGIRLNIDHAQAERALHEIGFCFLFAPLHHQAMKHVAAVRKNIGRRTIFNLLGPLASPAGAKRQLLGVSNKKFMPLMAEALTRLGSQSAWVVHGHDGMDEITMTAPTDCLQITQNKTKATEVTLSPDSFGLQVCRPEDLQGGTAEENAAALLSVLAGEDRYTAYRNSVIANSAALLIIAGRASDLEGAVLTVTRALDNGAPQDVFEHYRAFTRQGIGT